MSCIPLVLRQCYFQDFKYPCTGSDGPGARAGLLVGSDGPGGRAGLLVGSDGPGGRAGLSSDISTDAARLALSSSTVIRLGRSRTERVAAARSSSLSHGCQPTRILAIPTAFFTGTGMCFTHGSHRLVKGPLLRNALMASISSGEGSPLAAHSLGGAGVKTVCCVDSPGSCALRDMAIINSRVPCNRRTALGMYRYYYYDWILHTITIHKTVHEPTHVQ